MGLSLTMSVRIWKRTCPSLWWCGLWVVLVMGRWWHWTPPQPAQVCVLQCLLANAVCKCVCVWVTLAVAVCRWSTNGGDGRRGGEGGDWSGVPQRGPHARRGTGGGVWADTPTRVLLGGRVETADEGVHQQTVEQAGGRFPGNHLHSS